MTRPLAPLDLATTPMSGLDRLSRHLSHHADRQRIIASNLANIDTPGYRARDLSFEETLSQIQDDDGTQASMAWEEEVVIDDDEVPDQDGNTVGLERQMAKMSSNLVRYRSVSELLGRRVAMLRYAATDGAS